MAMQRGSWTWTDRDAIRGRRGIHCAALGAVSHAKVGSAAVDLRTVGFQSWLDASRMPFVDLRRRDVQECSVSARNLDCILEPVEPLECLYS